MRRRTPAPDASRSVGRAGKPGERPRVTDSRAARPRFGSAPSGVTCHARQAAYAVIRRRDGCVAAIHLPGTGPNRYWLPGGGIEPGETPEAAAMREVREELGRTIRLTARLGEAVQV